MGSPVSAKVANLYMKFFEDTAQKSSSGRPRLWKRYVDDIFCVIKRGAVTELLDYLNVLRHNVRFTVELEKDGTLPFLDTLLQWKDDGTLEVTVYRMPTHMDRYLNLHSQYPEHEKSGLVKCLFERARSIITTEESLREDEKNAVVALKWNGYPGTYICGASKALRSKEADQDVDMEETDRTPLVVRSRD